MKSLNIYKLDHFSFQYKYLKSDVALLDFIAEYETENIKQDCQY